MQNSQQTVMNDACAMPGTAGNGHLRPPNRPEFAGNMLTVPQACEAAGISIRQFYRMRERGLGPRNTILDGCRRIARSELERWLQSHTETRVGELPPAYRA